MPLEKKSLDKTFWSMEMSRAYQILETSREGLSEEEAKNRLKNIGRNKIETRRKLTKLSILWNQFRSPLIFILIAAGTVTAFLGEWVDTGMIFATVFVNAALGFWQENKAETVFELLKSYIRTRTRVKRDGAEREIDAEELVPGDIIRVSQGDRIPADGRIIFSNNFEVDEAVLTGESLPVKKDPAPVSSDTSLGDRSSMVWSGTLAVQGFADILVTATGAETEFGKIATSLEETSEAETPLRAAVSRFALFSGIILMFLTALVFVIGIANGVQLFEMFLISVSIAISAVPEGLPIALTVILAVGSQRIAAHNGVVRKLLAAETLGSTNIILTDKTGTLTQAKMELKEILPMEKGGIETEEILKYSLLNIDVVLENAEAEPKDWRLFGRPLEVSLARGAAYNGVSLSKVLKQSNLIDKLPFNSKNKYSAVVAETDKKRIFSVLGAPEIILALSNAGPELQKEWSEKINKIASEGKRLIGMAYKEVPSSFDKVPDPNDIKGLIFGGILVFQDPLRPNIAKVVERVTKAGVRTIIVTGDHQGTAMAIGKEVGLVTSADQVITGKELENMSDEELYVRKESIVVYSRVTPDQKVRIAKLWQQDGNIAAMIGDGVNDAPALRTANIGVAVGAGTDVAKGASDLVLMDNNFETLVLAIEEGRKILGNIRKVVVYLLSNMFGELFLIGGALLAGVALPLGALQILFINFFSDSFPAVALAFEEDIDPPGKRPRKLHKNLLDREMRFLILVIGAFTSILLFAIYLFLLDLGFDPKTVRTFIFASFASYTLFLSFSIRSLSRAITSYNPFSNKYLVAGAGVGLILTAAAIYLPFLQNILDTVPLSLPWILGIFGIGAISIVAVEIGKWLYKE